MQNRYFGDVGDFGKYGLLRKLCGLTASDGPALSLGINWYLVPDEGHNDDGKHISYLKKHTEYRACDTSLFDGLNDLLADGIRTVAKIEDSDLLPSNTTFFNDYLDLRSIPITGAANRSARLELRQQWLDNALEAVQSKDIIFLDPDNGFEIKSVKKHADKGPKYVFWNEANHFLQSDKTLVVYHHLNRTMTSADQIKIKMKEFKQNFPQRSEVIPVLFKRGSHRVFFVLPSYTHHDIIKSRVREFSEGEWQEHSEVFV